MAQIPNTRASTEGDGLNDYFNINTVNKRVELPNGATLVQYADNYATPGLQLTGAAVAPLASATSPALAGNGTIATANVGIARVTPATLVSGVILQAGTISGQECWVVNEGAAANIIVFAASGTSNVADGANCMIPGLSSQLFVWDSSTSLWYTIEQLVNGTLIVAQSATAPAVANSGTITTAGVGVARVAPAGAVTGIILQAGTMPGQSVWVVNEAAAANLIVFAASGTSNVADGANCMIPGLSSQLFIWDSATSLWYTIEQLVNGTMIVAQSATAPVIVNGNTITTTGVGVARVAPGGAVTGIILQAGVIAGQSVWVVNESTGANSVTFAASGTSNVADGTSDVIAGLTARQFIWDSATSLWYKAA